MRLEYGSTARTLLIKLRKSSNEIKTDFEGDILEILAIRNKNS